MVKVDTSIKGVINRLLKVVSVRVFSWAAPAWIKWAMLVSEAVGFELPQEGFMKHGRIVNQTRLPTLLRSWGCSAGKNNGTFLSMQCGGVLPVGEESNVLPDGS